MREVLGKIAGVSEVETFLDDREARVVYDPSKTNPESLARALTDHVGEHDFTAKVKS